MIEPTLIGYFARPTMKKADWPNSNRVEEIASASTCMSGCDWDWINEWRHNDLWVFDSPDLAMGVVPEDKRASCDLYAYRMFPIRYVEGRAEEFIIPPVEPIPLDASFEMLGFDIVSRYCGNCFECSPLSCNGLAEVVPTNRYCLLERLEDALCLAPTWEADGKTRPEPGPYYIVEIWRRRREKK